MRLGSLFTGYGGLDHAVEAVLGTTTAWVADNSPDATKVLTHRYPDVPNLGDVTKVDWADVEPVDVMCGGFPCQPVSHAGKRLGDKDERWLWDEFARAIGIVRPRIVVLENVRGLLSAGRGRLFGRVLGDLARLGYDATWGGVRAADAGAPHGRFRVFVVAADPDRGRLIEPDTRLRRVPVAHAVGNGALLPSPRATDGTKGGPNQRGSSGDLMLPGVVRLLPTPAVNDMGEGKTPDAWDEWTGTMQAKHGNGNGHGPSLAIEAQRLLPTPTDMDSHASGGSTSSDVTLTDATVRNTRQWGDYAAAIARWEHLTRPAPPPTVTSRKGTPQLSPLFTEWMMGLPAGWVTDVPGLSRNDMLRLCGNGVCPQQAQLALHLLLDLAERAA